MTSWNAYPSFSFCTWPTQESSCSSSSCQSCMMVPERVRRSERTAAARPSIVSSLSSAFRSSVLLPIRTRQRKVPPCGMDDPGGALHQRPYKAFPLHWHTSRLAVFLGHAVHPQGCIGRCLLLRFHEVCDSAVGDHFGPSTIFPV